MQRKCGAEEPQARMRGTVMTSQIAMRIQLGLAGALGGAAIWALVEGADRGWIGDYAALVLTGFVLTFVAALFAMAGPLGLWRASLRALGLGLVVACLLALTALRYGEANDFFHTPFQTLAGLVVATLPVPFLIAAAGTGWRDYPSLFLESWANLLRLSAAAAFAGLVWLVILLSSEVLSIVGIEVIRRLLDHDLVPLVVTGAALGVGTAVVHDLAEFLSPYVVLRLFRLFLPVVLSVMAVFLIALPFRGLDGLAGDLSPALLMLTMVAGGIALVAIAVDRTDAEATESPLLRRAAKGMALLLPVFAGLALYAVWLRVADYGWSPDRLFIACLALVGLAYGLTYAAAVLRGAGWMDRIRRGNLALALAVILLAALWLTPVLNAERISAANQLARFMAGTLPVEALDIAAIRSWGRPGAEVIAALDARAQEPGQEALAAVLAGGGTGAEPDTAPLAARLADLIDLQPVTATGTRDSLLSLAAAYQLQDWLQVCAPPLPDGSRPCLMVVADLLPLQPGEEAMLFLQRSADYVEIAGIFPGNDGILQYRSALRADGMPVDAAEAARLMQEYRSAPPPVTAALLNQLGTGEAGLLILP